MLLGVDYSVPGFEGGVLHILLLGDEKTGR